MTGALPRTTDGTPSYRYAAALVRTKLDEMMGEMQAEYGLTVLEVADILNDSARDRLKWAVADQHKRSRHRREAIT